MLVTLTSMGAELQSQSRVEVEVEFSDIKKWKRGLRPSIETSMGKVRCMRTKIAYLRIHLYVGTIDEFIKGDASLRRYGITFDDNINITCKFHGRVASS